MIEWLMLGATAGGPLVGIWVTRLIDRANDKVRRREAIFEALIRTRGLELSPDHVCNLNMVPLVFKEPSILAEYSRVMTALNDPALSSPDEMIGCPAGKRLAEARLDMLREIGKAVGTPLPEKEAERYGYAPMAWQKEYNESTRLRQALVEVVEGRKPLPMVAGVYQLPAQGEPLEQLANPEREGVDP